ncbi:hypothetical protein ACFL4P_01345 [Gemmatimonadota bacterium]
MTVEIRMSGAAALVLAEPAEDFLRAVANTEPESRKLSQGEEASKGDPVAVAALILAIPGALLATMDLIERAKVAEKVRKLLKKAREGDGNATLHVVGEMSLDLTIATEDEVIDLLAENRDS